MPTLTLEEQFVLSIVAAYGALEYEELVSTALTVYQNTDEFRELGLSSINAEEIREEIASCVHQGWIAPVMPSTRTKLFDLCRDSIANGSCTELPQSGEIDFTQIGASLWRTKLPGYWDESRKLEKVVRLRYLQETDRFLSQSAAERFRRSLLDCGVYTCGPLTPVGPWCHRSWELHDWGWEFCSQLEPPRPVVSEADSDDVPDEEDECEESIHPHDSIESGIQADWLPLTLNRASEIAVEMRLSVAQLLLFLRIGSVPWISYLNVDLAVRDLLAASKSNHAPVVEEQEAREAIQDAIDRKLILVHSTDTIQARNEKIPVLNCDTSYVALSDCGTLDFTEAGITLFKRLRELAWAGAWMETVHEQQILCSRSDVFFVDEQRANEFCEHAASEPNVTHITQPIAIGTWRPRWWIQHKSGFKVTVECNDEAYLHL